MFIKKFKIEIKKEIIRLSCLSYISYLISIVWINPVGTLNYIPINLIPLGTILSYFNDFGSGHLSYSIIVSNLLGNILLTLPLGFFIFYKYRNLKLGQVFILSFALPIIIELVQLSLHFMQLGTRVVDIDDVILNMLGIILGYYLTKFLFQRNQLKLIRLSR